MYLDMKNLFTSNLTTGAIAQTITASAAGLNVIPLSSLPTDAAHKVPSPQLRCLAEPYAQVIGDFSTCDSVTISLQTDNDEEFGSPTTLRSSGAVATSSLKAGYKFDLGGALGAGLEDYLRLYITVAGSNAGAGSTILAGLTFDGGDTNGY